MAEMRRVLPGTLHLSPTRPEGADDRKYTLQEIEFGASVEGMPPLDVIEGKGSELMIFNGITRATRAYRYHPCDAVVVQVIDALPFLDMSPYLTIEEVCREEWSEE